MKRSPRIHWFSSLWVAGMLWGQPTKCSPLLFWGAVVGQGMQMILVLHYAMLLADPEPTYSEWTWEGGMHRCVVQPDGFLFLLRQLSNEYF